MPQVSRATTPERNRMQATEKSGEIIESVSPGTLSGTCTDANDVTDSAGPNIATSQVR